MVRYIFKRVELYTAYTYNTGIKVSPVVVAVDCYSLEAACPTCQQVVVAVAVVVAARRFIVRTFALI